MKRVLVTASVLLVANALSIDQHWDEFKRNHGKTYKSLFEERQRYNIFQDNLRGIEKHNERYARGEVSFEQGITVFTDRTVAEFESLLSKYKVNKLRYPTVHLQFEDNANHNKSVDWVQMGAVTEVRYQGLICGSCWAITVAEAVEARVYISKGKLEKLSTQNLMDCSRNYGNNGCLGGQFETAFNYIEDNGILSDKEYPYTYKDGICRKTGGVKIDHYINIENNYKAMEYFIANTGPICAAISIDPGFAYYKKGIIDGREACGKKMETLNHAVLLVGYGIEKDTAYWIIKNSWGSGWGEKGYFKLKRGEDNVCGINLDCSFPVL